MNYYFYSPNFFSKQQFVDLTENAIELFKVVDKNNSTIQLSIPFNEIAIIKLGWVPKNKHEIEYYCEITQTSTNQKLNFFSWGDRYHYKNYVNFIYALHEICAIYPNIQFVHVTEPTSNVLTILLGLIISPFLLWGIHLWGNITIIILAVALFLIGLLFNKEQLIPYKPDNIPVNLLSKY